MLCIYYLCYIIYHSSIQYNLQLFFSLFKIQKNINYIILLNAIYIVYVIMQAHQYYIKKYSLFQNQIISSKKISFKRFFFSFKKWMLIWRRRCYHEWLRHILQRARRSSEVTPIDRGSKISYTKNLQFDNEKKFFQRKNDV